MSDDTRSSFETPWILRDPAVAPHARTDPSLRLFCLPQAGCGAWSYHGWQNRLPPHVEVLPVEYPGRNSRLTHRFEYRSLQDLASAVVDAIEPLLSVNADASKDVASKSTAPPPYVLLGWSMGAWLGYEMVLEIARRTHLALPLRVFLGGARSPSLAGPEFDPDRETPALSGLPKPLFWEAFARRYGPNPNLEASEALRDLLLPTLRKDFALMERYVPSVDETPGSSTRCLGRRDEEPVDASVDVAEARAGFARVATEEKRFSSTEEPAEKKKENAFPRVAAARLPVPLVAFGAHGDARYDPAQLSAWRDVAALDQNALTDRGDRSRDPSKPERFERFLERWFPGGRATPHRLLLDRPNELVRFLNEALRS